MHTAQPFGINLNDQSLIMTNKILFNVKKIDNENIILKKKFQQQIFFGSILAA